MNQEQRCEYLRLLALACSSWGNPPKWGYQPVSIDGRAAEVGSMVRVRWECTREHAEIRWAEFLKSCVPAEEYRLSIEGATEQLDNQRPRLVVLCGSSRFVDVMAVCAWLIEREEGAITMGLHLLPHWYPNCPDDHLAEAEGVSSEMDALHLRKIDLCDEVFIVNVGDYIGDSTRKEIEYAMEHRKQLRWFTFDPLGARVRAMLSVVTTAEGLRRA